MADRTGQHLGNYQLVKLLGSGGFAQVYLGRHVHLESLAAVKLLHAQFATASELELFRTEAQTIASLHHPHIVRLLDFGVEEGTPYLVVDYAPHGSLRQRFPSGTRLSPSTILPVLVQVASALQYAHEQQVIHRDIKPENLLLGRSQEVLLTDFGIATVAQNTSQQRTQGVAGTAAYMAPEQLQGKPRPASDLYALGVVVYEWLGGERPFQGGPLEVISQHLTVPPPPLREKAPDLPPAIEHVVLTALAKDPKDRFGSVRAFATAFRQACGEAGSAYLLSTQAILPVAPAPELPQTSQGDRPRTNAPVERDAPPGGQAEEAGTSIFSATTHLSPQPTPSLSPPSVPSGLGSQSGPVLFTAETQLFSPEAGGGAALGGAPTNGATGVTAPVTPPASGWAAQQTAGGSGTVLPATAEVAYQAGRTATASDERVLDDVPAPPGVPVPLASTRQGKRDARRWALVVAACLLVLALLGGGALYELPQLFHASSTAHSISTAVSPATGATVTITPARSDLKNTFTITGVTGTPDASQMQVGARMVSVTTQAHSTTVNATGQQTTPGTQAHGTLSVYNEDTTSALTLTAGTTFTNTYGNPSSLVMVLDASVTLPVAPPSSYTYTTAPGHIAQVGTIGNLPASSPTVFFDYVYCVENGGTLGPCYSVSNATAFTGGTDPQPYTVVAQSDIDNAASGLIQANQPDAGQVVQGQLQANEQLVGTQQCSPNTSANHRAGDQASQVTVTVSFTCTGLAYDHDGALALGAKLLMDQAANTPGAGYALVGQIKTSLVSATPDQQGGVTIVVQAAGIWVYQFSASQKQALASLIAGKSQQEAMSEVAARTGVAQVQIQLQGGNGQILPTDSQKIMIVIQTVPGA